MKTMSVLAVLVVLLVAGAEAAPKASPKVSPKKASPKKASPIKASPKPMVGPTSCIAAGPFIRYQNTNVATKKWQGSFMIMTSTRLPEVPTLTITDGTTQYKIRTKNMWTQKIGNQEFKFWRAAVSLPITDEAQTFTYRYGYSKLSLGRLTGCGRVMDASMKFTVAAAEEEMHFGFYSGMDDEASAKHPAHTWGHLAQVHKIQPYHLLVGLGDLINNEGVLGIKSLLKVWSGVSRVDRASAFSMAAWTPALRASVEQYYFKSYMSVLAQDNYRMAQVLAGVPTANLYDDMDIFPGLNSHSALARNSRVYKGIVAAGQRYFNLFQMQHAPNAASDVFIKPGYTTIKYVGPTSQLLLLDTRAELTDTQVISNSSYQNVFNKLSTKGGFLYVATSRSIVSWDWPNATALSNATAYPTLASAVSQTGPFGDMPFLTEISEQWGAPAHKAEKRTFVYRLVDFANATNTRVTFLSGDLGLMGTGGFANINLDGELAVENDPEAMNAYFASPMGAQPLGFALCSVYNTLGEQPVYHNRNGSSLIHNSTMIQYLDETFVDPTNEEDSTPLYPHFCGSDGMFLLPVRNFGDIFNEDGSAARVRMWYETNSTMSRFDQEVMPLSKA